MRPKLGCPSTRVEEGFPARVEAPAPAPYASIICAVRAGVVAVRELGRDMGCDLGRERDSAVEARDAAETNDWAESVRFIISSLGLPPHRRLSLWAALPGRSARGRRCAPRSRVFQRQSRPQDVLAPGAAASRGGVDKNTKP